ncbi:putative PLP-dependent enzyme possibly involved in cell wall biogenesis [Candidatus Methanoperedens nitroreducens]|uniref:Putative PLP-dependent enzyme possibly involved in cell wall biogenesis n=1 Tax=Candidatus Methanoperedens nitratireducens TaxID=1392998 RepID=A0A062V8V6_9EURY|nr:DegT/DnrJ/EryC1/StrS family aminotransferase [Candidatus Methanoperedens nitroreducens]KCZ72199.1 putative PLP-dependent enzyme possibly involved in cell wall biogenesis [Candidatus Methanoperedens nitroreducens]MDJ1421822.1 DegT/DnrJ/EryC1/StrS family aminotransferase [Candidatus Methanoperedens sp.]
MIFKKPEDLTLDKNVQLYDFNRRWAENARYLSQGLKGIEGIGIPHVRKGCTHVFHQYTIRVTDGCKFKRDMLVKILGENGIGTGIYYPIPIHKQPFYNNLGYRDSLRNTEIASKRVISLPVHPTVTREDLDHIIRTIEEAAG